jgi:hypothetical protein
MYEIKVNEQQLKIMQYALDMYSRIGCGQVGIAVTDHPDHNCLNKEFDRYELRKKLDDVARGYLNPDLQYGVCYGITSKHVGESNRVAYDMFQVIRGELNNNSSFLPSLFKTSKENLIQITEGEHNGHI